MKNFIIFILLCVITYQSASEKPWFASVKNKVIGAIEKIVGKDFGSVKVDEVLEESTLVPAQPKKNTSQPSTTPSPTVAYSGGQLILQDGPLINLSTLQFTNSGNNTFLLQSDGSITITTKSGTPKASVSFIVSPTTAFNYIYFDLDFVSDTQAQGIFTAFVDGKNLGYMDERYFGPIAKKQTTGFSLLHPGSHIINFTLDQVGGSPTSVTIKNFGTGVYVE